MKARVGILVFPGTNSEEETLRACEAVGLDAHLLHWTALSAKVREFDAYVLPGGFAYEDRVRAGAIAAHDRLMEAVKEGAANGKLVLGICNGAQILLEAGLAPDADGSGRPQAGFTRNLPSGRFRCTRVYVKFTASRKRCVITAALEPGTVIPVWASHGEGRLAADPIMLERLRQEEYFAFTYCRSDGETVNDPDVIPNGSPFGSAGITNRAGNVLAIMPHPEREAWMEDGGITVFESFAAAL
jgi:phosphoribosylformylglycinamidine synthase subunit PurQ / glutaminase